METGESFAFASSACFGTAFFFLSNAEWHMISCSTCAPRMQLVRGKWPTGASKL